MVAKWQISIETAPQQSDFPRQRINIEIANVPAYTRELMPLRLNYDFLLGYGAVLVNVESLNEIMADKVIAYPAATKYVRFRDIWDLAWLSQQGAKLDPALVKLKMVDYQIADFPALLQSAIARLPEVVASKGFMDQMLRFIDSDTIAATLDKPQFLEYLVNVVSALFVAMARHLGGAAAVDGASGFRM